MVEWRGEWEAYSTIHQLTTNHLLNSPLQSPQPSIHPRAHPSNCSLGRPLTHTPTQPPTVSPSDLCLLRAKSAKRPKVREDFDFRLKPDKSASGIYIRVGETERGECYSSIPAAGSEFREREEEEEVEEEGGTRENTWSEMTEA
ncbi:hypothetical protein E2C01_035491 [Portunus trituberculatus]|uniref:Uncharacterized protein n=1 Tax=Portunus trituberculatus TaxID=210409 RepID=A0A5B7F9X6_PORTR|nr:hypothetical protein [Portunus trituberculatus]